LDKGLFGMESFFCKGGWNVMPNRIGWGGLGGSVFNFSQKKNISFAYTTNLMELLFLDYQWYWL